jgi:rare lipoprotein A
MSSRSSSKMVKHFTITLLIVLAVLSAACAGKAVSLASPESGEPSPEVGQPSPISVPDQTYRETGVAAWYGKDFHGKKTASGETFDMNALTAAHRTLPLGTMIRVTNLDNFKSIKVRVNDRGPFVRNRILDLSLGAAKELGFIAQGTARVKIETLEAVSGSALYTVQAAAFAEEESARMLKDRLNKKFKSVSVVPFETNLARFYRVNIGSYQSEERAEQVASKLTLEGFEPIVVRKDPSH